MCSSAHDQSNYGGNVAQSSDQPGVLLVISGPSGVGKTTITHEVEKRLGGAFSVSATTRPKTAADVEGRDYYFIDEPTFQQWINDEWFLEYAKVFGRYWYGTPREPVMQQLAQGRLVILEIDVQGALQVKRIHPDAYMLFILPPSDEELLRRLTARQRDDAEVIRRRFNEAQREIAVARSSGVYDDFLINDDLASTVARACAMIQQRRALRRCKGAKEST